jgi:hypothetical protein
MRHARKYSNNSAIHGFWIPAFHAGMTFGFFAAPHNERFAARQLYLGGCSAAPTFFAPHSLSLGRIQCFLSNMVCGSRWAAP